MKKIILVLLVAFAVGCTTTASTSIKYYEVDDMTKAEQELRKGRMIEVTTHDGKTTKMAFKKFDEYNNELHGEENFRLKVIPVEDIAQIKVVTKTYKVDEQESKEAAAGAGAGILYGIGCVVGALLGGKGDCRRFK